MPGVLPAAPTLVKALGDASGKVSRWQPPVDAAAWRHRRPEVDRAFRRALGLEVLPTRTPLNARTVSRFQIDDITVETVVFESRPGFQVTADLYLPSSATATGAATAGSRIARHPAIVSPIGHFLSAGKTATDVQARCQGLAKLGFVVLTYDALGQGERMVPGNIHHEAGYALLPLGETIAGWMVWDSMRALDYLETRPEVDPNRLGMTGNSGGGLNTLFTAAIDSRVKSAVVVGFTFQFAHWIQYGGSHCTCTHLPAVFEALEWFEIAGLITPRAVLMLQGTEDAIFPITGARASAAGVSRIAQLVGHPERARLTELTGQPHAYTRPYREHLYAWMQTHLQRRAPADTVPEPAINPLPEQDARLLCDPQRRWIGETPTVVDLARAEARRRLDAADTQPATAVQTEKSREAIRSWARSMSKGNESGDPLFAARILARGTNASVRWEKLAFNSEEGVRLPAVLWLPVGARGSTNRTHRTPVVLVADSRGKSRLAETAAWPAALAERGTAVLAVDVRGRGETLTEHAPGYDSNFRLVAAQVLSGTPIAGRRAYDLSRAVSYLAIRPELDPGRVTLVGLGEDAVPALLEALGDPRVGRLVLAGGRRSLVSQQRARPAPPRERMGDQWNDPQLHGWIETGDDRIDLGSVIPYALAPEKTQANGLKHAVMMDLPELISAMAPRPVTVLQSSDLQGPDREWVERRFQRVVGQIPTTQSFPELGGDAADWIRLLADTRK